MVSYQAKEPIWLKSLRRRSSERLNETGYPTKKHENWRYTDIEEILNTPFGPARLNLRREPCQSSGNDDLLDKEFYFNFTSQRNDQGNEASYISVSKAHDTQVFLMPMREAILADHKFLKDYLHITSFQEDKHSFFLENTSLFQDGLLLHVGTDTPVDRQVYLKFEIGEDIGTKKVKNAYYLRNLIIVEEGASLELLEDHASLGTPSYLTQVVNEIILKPNSRFKHTKVQRQSDSSYHLAFNRVLQYGGSYYSNDLLMVGSNLSRNEIQVKMLDEGCTSHLNGVYIGEGKQSLGQSTYVAHVKPNAVSSQIYHGILKGMSNAAFQGEIYVHPQAQKTKAHQSNKTLLLSKESRMNSKPHLRIFADDVECTHGVTMGNINEESLFYLRSRGISEHEAMDMLSFAFLQKALEETSEGMRSYLGKIIKEKLSSS